MKFEEIYDEYFADLALEDIQDWFTIWIQYFDSFSDPKLVDWPLMATPTGPLSILLIYFIIIFYGKKYIRDRKSPPIVDDGQDNIDEGIQEDDGNDDEDTDNDKENTNDTKEIKVTKAEEEDLDDDDEDDEDKSDTDNRKKESEKSPDQDVDSKFSVNTSRIFTAILFLYNCSVSMLNGWIAYELLTNALENEYNFLCELVYPYTDDLHENRIAYAMWWYWASKGIELLDTLFIILKGKSTQLTFLHIYHHSSMFTVWWIGAKFVPGGSAVSGAFVNCLVHVLMYLYYALSSLKCCKRVLQPWKRRLTILQMIQFTVGIVLGLNSIVTGCAFTRWMQYVFVAYAASFLILFLQFYVRTYRRRQSA